MNDFDAKTHVWVTRAIRTEMVRSGITFGELAERLVMVGGDENERNLRNKVARGTFSAALFVQCLAAIGCKTLTIDLLDRLYAGSDPDTPPPSVSRAQRIAVVRAVREALAREPSARGAKPGFKEVIDAVERTNLLAFSIGEASLEDAVRAVRETLDKTPAE
jgi:hypothetical protein